MPEGDYEAIENSGCLRAAGGRLALYLAGAAIFEALVWCVSCSHARPAPTPTPVPPAPEVIRVRVPIYDSCPPPADLPRPDYWPLVVDALSQPTLELKLQVLEYLIRSAVGYGDDQALILEPYRRPPPAP